MLSDAALKYLQSLGAQQPGPNQPWSQMLGQNFSSQPVQAQVRSPLASYADMPLPGGQAASMAVPPMEQPKYSPLPESPDQSGSMSQGSVSMNPEMLSIYKKLQAEAQNSINEQRGYADKLKSYRDRVAQQELNPDYTALMMASDAWGGTHFQPQYKKPMTAEERDAQANAVDAAIAGQLGNISKEKLNMLKTQQEGLLQSQKFQEAGNQKMSDQDEKDRQALMKALDTEKSSGRFTPIGKAQGNIYQAERIQALIDQYKKDPNSMPLTGPASLSEVAIGLNSLLSATGGSEESRKSLIPSSLRGKYSTLEQFIMNEPRGANMEAFVKNASDTLSREKSTNQRQIDNYRNKLEGSWGLGRFAKRHPGEFGKMIDLYSSPSEQTQAPTPTAASNAANPGPSKSDIEAEKEAIYQKFPNLRPK